MKKLKPILIAYLMLLLALFCLYGCNTPEPCSYTVEEFTQQIGNDVIQLQRTFTTTQPPKDFVKDGIKYLYVVIENYC